MDSYQLNAYILTIAKANSARALHAKNEWQASGLSYQFVKGVRAKDINLMSHYSSFQNRLHYKRPMTMSEIATYIGHKRLWQAMLNSDATYALMLEDDASIIDTARFPCALIDIMASTQSGLWDILKLFNYSSKKIIAKQYFGDTKLICTKYPAYGAVAYIISKDAAKKLLARSSIYRPIDEDLARPWEFKLKVWSTAENLIDERADALGGSLLAQQRDEMERQTAQNNLLFPLKRNILEASKTIHSFAYKRYILKSVALNKKRP